MSVLSCLAPIFCVHLVTKEEAAEMQISSPVSSWWVDSYDSVWSGTWFYANLSKMETSRTAVRESSNLGKKKKVTESPLVICWNGGIMFRICVDVMDWMQVKYKSRTLTTVLYTLSRCLNLKMLNEDVWSNLTHLFVAIMESNAAISELTFMSKDKK